MNTVLNNTQSASITKFELLSEKLTRHYCQKILMPAGATELLEDIAARIKSDKRLFEIYRDFYESYIGSGYWTTVWEPLKINPYVEEVFGNHSSLFYLHAALERLPCTEQRYRELGIGEDLFVETLRDIGMHVQRAYDLVGYYCIRNFTWIWRHLEARMFRLGRLQYLIMPFNGAVKGFYNSSKDILLLLSKGGIELRENGDMQGVCKKEKTAGGFITQYLETEDSYVGNPVTPYGKGIQAQIRLKKKAWEKILDENDCLLDIHIPKDGEFNLKTVMDSYEQAGHFFKKFFSGVTIKGMYCHTWLFSPQLQEMLPGNSNIVRFQRQFYLYPTVGSVDFLWKNVFNDLTEVKDAKPDTFLRRKVLEYIEEDKEIFDLKGIFLDAAGTFGNSSYMDKYDRGEYPL